MAHQSTQTSVLYPAFECLKGKRLILASSSPRRIELFNRMGLCFEVIASNFEEDYDKSTFATPTAYCAATCLCKGESVKQATVTATTEDHKAPSMIVSSDTIVVCDGTILEKPVDRADAVRMLAQVSGKDIEVVTAVTIFYRTAPGQYEKVCFEETSVMHMMEYGMDMIEAYLNTGEGMDHSGALAYQGAAFLMVKSISGCLYSLIGFPAARFHQQVLAIASQII